MVEKERVRWCIQRLVVEEIETTLEDVLKMLDREYTRKRRGRMTAI